MSVPFLITIRAWAKKLYEPLRKIKTLKLGVTISRINSHQTSWSIIPNVPQLCAVCLYLPPLKLIINFTILQLLPTFKTTKSIWHHLGGVIHCANACMHFFFSRLFIAPAIKMEHLPMRVGLIFQLKQQI